VHAVKTKKRNINNITNKKERLFMENFKKNLISIIKSNSTTYTCFALNTKGNTIVGMDVTLSQKQLADFMSKCIKYLTEKIYSKMQIGNYPESDPKDFIEKLSIENALIKKYCTEICTIPLSPETNIIDPLCYDAYMIIAEKGNKQTVFITKKRIFKIYGKKNFVFTAVGGTDYEPLSDKLVKLVMHFDCIVHDKYCYFVTINGKSIFKLEETDEVRSLETKNLLIENNIIASDAITILDHYMEKSGKMKCFAHVNEEIMNEFKNITKKNKKILEQKYSLPIISDDKGIFHVDISSEEKLHAFIDTITNRRALSFDNKIVVSKSPFISSQ
jgi:hypothetical protein